MGLESWPKTPDKKINLESEKSPEQKREVTMDAGREKRAGLARRIFTSEIVSNGLDVLPIAGSGKMLLEAIYGDTLAGKELNGKDRIIHGAIGAGMLPLDFIGVGEAGRVINLSGKALPLVEKLGAKLAEKGAVRGAMVFAKTSEFMARHPEAVAKAERLVESKIRQHLASARA